MAKPRPQPTQLQLYLRLRLGTRPDPLRPKPGGGVSISVLWQINPAKNLGDGVCSLRFKTKSLLSKIWSAGEHSSLALHKTQTRMAAWEDREGRSLDVILSNDSRPHQESCV
jgi:hypothetical protein